MIAHSVADPFYYLCNFQQVLAWVQLRYADLLDEQEHTFMQQFATLGQASQALLVRMVMRKGVMFRASKLSYSEIGAIEPAAAPLVALGWLDDQPALGLDHLFQLLRKDEIASCFAAVLERPRAAKAELLEQLSALDHSPQPLCQWWPGFDEPVYVLHLQALCDRLRLLFFGNLHQDWSEFVLADLGLLRYEQVAFGDDSRALRERADIDLCLALHTCAEQLEAGQPVEQVLALLDGLQPSNPWLERRRARLLFQLGQQCERSGDWAQALCIYPRSRHPQARIRHIRVLERSADYAAALSLANEVSTQPASALEVQALARIVPRLQRKLGGPPQRRRAPAPISRLDLCLPADLSALGVEQAVQVHLAADDGPVHYVENTLFNSLFGLLCWEAIFAPVPGAFFHPFQSGPLDLHDAGFQARRAEHFAACLGQLDDERYRHTILANYQAKHGLQSPFVYWELLDATLLQQALDCLPAAHLKRCFERLLEDIQANRAGMPDLIQFWPGQRRYRMIEVKGPGDRLQDNQLRWIAFCTEHGLPVEVCHVQWAQPAA